MKQLRIRGTLRPLKRWPSVVVDLIITEEKDTGEPEKKTATTATSLADFGAGLGTVAEAERAFRQLGRVLERRRRGER